MASDVDELNPYEAPKAKGEDNRTRRPKKKTSRSSDGDALARSRIVDAFARTRRWLTFFGVLSYIGAALIVVAGLATQSMSALSRTYSSETFVVTTVVTVVIGILYVVIGLRLFRYRDAVDRVEEGDLSTVANAVERQQEWWAFIGRLTIAGMVLYALLIVLLTFSFALLAPPR